MYNAYGGTVLFFLIVERVKWNKNMNLKNNIIFFALAGAAAVSCGFLDPEIDNTRDESILEEAAYFCGPLNDVYANLPNLFDLSMDVMTDNALSRIQSGSYYRCGTGAMSPHTNPLDVWTQCYKNIRSLNVFLNRMVLDEDTDWKTPVRFFPLNSEADYQNNLDMFWRLKGEAYAMRAYWMSVLLRNFGGMAANGEMLGVPLVGDRILSTGKDDLKIPRATYDQCVEAIVADCDRAVEECGLPDLYKGNSPVFGTQVRDHISGAAAKAIKARVLLYAASPANNLSGDITKWEKAAVAAAEAVKAAGGINAAFSTRDEYYFTKLNDAAWKNYDVIMRGCVVTGNRAFETDNYPPELYGSASINVSQNFVDIFPDSEGYPISESSIYDHTSPYAGRDSRLALFVGYHGGKVGSYQLDIAEGGNDAYDLLKNTSRSGYYLKKNLRMSVVLKPGAQTATPRANILFGLPEVLLNYAEAANKAWGVTGDPQGYGFTAKQALNRILTRDNKTGAKYLNQIIGNDQDMFDEYVRLQRRIELAFEGHYFYDLRRWYASSQDWETRLNTEIYGIKVSADGTGYDPYKIEDRKFVSPYQPIPYSEVYNAGLVQNKGW